MGERAATARGAARERSGGAGGEPLDSTSFPHAGPRAAGRASSDPGRRWPRSTKRRLRRAVLGLLALAVGCSGPAITETAMSMPGGTGGLARLVLKVQDEPVVVRFEPSALDHLEWSALDVDEAPPNPLVDLPPGPRPVAAWVLRARRRGSTALVPVVYLAVRDEPVARHMVYVTRVDAAPCEPGTAFDLRDDGTVRVFSPSGPPLAPVAPPLPGSGLWPEPVK